MSLLIIMQIKAGRFFRYNLYSKVANLNKAWIIIF